LKVVMKAKPMKAKIMKVMKAASKPKIAKMVMKAKRLGRTALTGALVAMLKSTGGRSDLKYDAAHKAATGTMHLVPLKERAGYPLKFPKGSVDPKNWRTGITAGSERGGKPVIVDFNRASWLPDDWGQGIKSTSPISRPDIKPGNGGTYTVFMSPTGETFYHKWAGENASGRTFTDEGGRNGQIRKAQLQGQQSIQVVRAQIRDSQFTGSERIGFDGDDQFFKLLSPQERKCLASKDAFHFCIVSARRATSLKGIQDIFMVQSQFLEAGVTPTWYVDEGSLADYRKLGLKAVVGGKLTAARNQCLKDASKMGKACVQASDDISAWEYRHGKRATERKNDDALNKACAEAQRFILSPVAAARFILAKMRAAPGDKKPQLGGLYMLSSCSRTFGGEEFVRQHFVIGDFFVVDKSHVRFDETMTLKEDYDFSCSHIKAHGSVMRCQRMTLNVKHYSNAGGAVDERDKKGEKERMNIGILHRKWPACFRANPKRQNEVIMKWRGVNDADGDDELQDKERPKASTARKVRGVKKQLGKAHKAKHSSVLGEYPPTATLVLTAKAKLAKHAERVKKLAGLTVAKALGKVVKGAKAKDGRYALQDLRYDLKCGYLQLKGGKGAKA